MSDPRPKRTAEEAKARRRLERTVGRKLPPSLHCSFCGKSQDAVAKLVAGPFVFICNECVGLCADAMAGKPVAADAGFKPLEQPEATLLSLMGSVSYGVDTGRDFLQQLVDELRRREVSWADIGKALGVSRQSAWERFS